jgi:acetyl esterase/lipase
MDAQRAMSLIRSKGEAWKLDPRRIGILGFSAGGETAGLTSLFGDQRAYEKIDEADDAPCGPSFAVLVYPAGFLDRGSGGLKTYLKVSAKSPPTFFAMTQDDGVNPENCLVLFSALMREKVPVELHIYTRGGHGYGLRATETPVTRWSDRAAEWLRDMGFHKSSSEEP